MTAQAEISKSRKARRDVVLTLARAAGAHGATRHELADAIGIPVHAVCPAVFQLVKAGELENAGRTRPTGFGGHAQVLVVVSHD